MLELPAPGAEVSVAVLGGGLMGHALAAIFLDAGMRTTVYECVDAVRETLPARVAAELDGWRGNHDATERLHVAATETSIPLSTQWVVEAVTENLALKQELLANVERHLPEAVFATNSSVFRTSDVAGRMARPEHLAGTHWWNPPHLMPIVEVVHGTHTSAELLEWTTAMLEFCGKKPVQVRVDTPGFIGNRLQHALWREAFALVEEGIADAETVDLVVRETLGRKLRVLGPLENADYIGLDLTAAIHDYVFPALSTRSSAAPLLMERVQQRALGAKTGEGLLRWPAGRKEAVAARLAKQLQDSK